MKGCNLIDGLNIRLMIEKVFNNGASTISASHMKGRGSHLIAKRKNC